MCYNIYIYRDKEGQFYSVLNKTIKGAELNGLHNCKKHKC